MPFDFKQGPAWRCICVARGVLASHDVVRRNDDVGTGKNTRIWYHDDKIFSEETKMHGHTFGPLRAVVLDDVEVWEDPPDFRHPLPDNRSRTDNPKHPPLNGIPRCYEWRLTGSAPATARRGTQRCELKAALSFRALKPTAQQLSRSDLRKYTYPISSASMPPAALPFSRSHIHALAKT